MTWPFCKKDPLPVINVYTPMLYRDVNKLEHYIGLDKTENKMYFCSVKPTDLIKTPLKEGDLKHLEAAFPIVSIEKKVNGGLILFWEGGRITAFDLLTNGKIFATAEGKWWVHTPEKKLFERTGHAEFDLLECLFTA